MSDDSNKFLLKLARDAIKSKFNNDKLVLENIPSQLKEMGCCFVTLTINGELRGCIGHLEAFEPLYKNVVDNAINAAFHDSRFNPLTLSELDQLRIEISILSPPSRLSYSSPEDLLSKLSYNHGVIFRKGFNSSTFLPQVWDVIPDKVEFLQNLSVKAGLSPDAWRDKPEISVYTVEKIREVLLTDFSR